MAKIEGKYRLVKLPIPKCLVVFPLLYERLMQSLQSNGFGERRVTDRRQTESEKYYIEDTYHFRFHFLPLLLKTRQCFLRHKYAQG